MKSLRRLIAIPVMIAAIAILPLESIRFLLKLFLCFFSDAVYALYVLFKYGLPLFFLLFFRDWIMMNAALSLFSGLKAASILLLLGYFVSIIPGGILAFIGNRSGHISIYDFLGCSVAFRLSVIWFGWGLYHLGVHTVWLEYFQREGWRREIPSEFP